MNIDLNQIRDKFDGLCSGSASREEIASFASRAIEADDIGTLHLEKSNESKNMGSDPVLKRSGFNGRSGRIFAHGIGL
ncbi:hypothetical protein [Rhizobium yanglingense]